MIELSKPILVVVAHPDDELLGPGGSIHRFCQAGATHIRCLILGEGLTSRADERDPDAWSSEMARHRADIEKARKALGYHSVAIHDFPDNRFDRVDLLDLIKVIEAEIDKLQPHTIWTHHGGDTNIDHQRTFDAVVTACRPTPGQIVDTLMTFETLSSTEWQAPGHKGPFLPNAFCQISEEDLNAKIEAMACYSFETRAFPHPRSPEAIRALAQKRGSESGNFLAEAFEVIRIKI